MRCSFMSVSKGRVDSLHSVCKVEAHSPNRAANFCGKECKGTTHFGFRTPSEVSKEDMAALMR